MAERTKSCAAIGHAPLRSTAPGPALHSRAFAQRRLPGCASFGFCLGRACALLCLVQPPRRLHGRRLPARQGFCGRRERGQLGDLAPAPLTRRSSLHTAYYLQPCHIWIKSVCCLHYLYVSFAEFFMGLYCFWESCTRRLLILLYLRCFVPFPWPLSVMCISFITFRVYLRVVYITFAPVCVICVTRKLLGSSHP